MIKIIVTLDTSRLFMQICSLIHRSYYQTLCDNDIWKILDAGVDDKVLASQADDLYIEACEVFGVEYEEVDG